MIKKAALVVITVVLGGFALTFLVSLLWGGYFIRSTINGVVADIAARSGISTYLLRGVVLIVTIPFFWALSKYTGRVWNLISVSTNPLQPWTNKYGMIVISYIGLYWLALYAAGQQSIAEIKWCVDTPEGMRVSDDPGKDPIYGIVKHKCTEEDAKAIRSGNGQLHQAREIQIDNPLRYRFFDSVTHHPLVWYAIDSEGKYRFYDRSGYDPIGGEPLLPITAQVVSELRINQAREERVRTCEAQRSEAEQRSGEAASAFENKQYDVTLSTCSAVLRSAAAECFGLRTDSPRSRCVELTHDASVEKAHLLVDQAKDELQRAEIDAALRSGRAAVALDPENLRAKEIVEVATALKGTHAAIH